MTKATWPFPDRPGVPPKDGPYWLQCKSVGDMQPCNYQEGKWFCIGTALPLSLERVAAFYNYLGPCLTPEEIARREDTKWHEGYAAGVSDIRRGVAFGEPDTHYAANAARVAELEGALRKAKQHFVADEPLKAFIEICAAFGGKDE